MLNKTIPPGYKTQAEDTTPEAEIIFYQMLRNLTLEKRLQQALKFNKQVRAIFWENLGKKYSELNLRNRKQKLIEWEFGKTIAEIDR